MAAAIKDYAHRLYSLMDPTDLSDAMVVLKIMLVMLALRYVLTGSSQLMRFKRVPILTAFIRRHGIAKRNKEFKLAESIWYLCWHVTSMYFTLGVLKLEYGTHLDHKWLYYFIRDSNGVWFFSESFDHVANKMITWPYITMTPETRWLMLLSLGFWMSCCIYIQWETRRSDMRIMRFHHISTVALIALNYKFKFHRLGMIIIFLHDIPDVLLYLTKCLSYLRESNRTYSATAFVLYGLSHFITRLVLLGRYIAYPVLKNMDYVDSYGGPLRYICTLPGGIICVGLVGVLTVMNIYWLKLIISMARVFARGEEIADKREDD